MSASHCSGVGAQTHFFSPAMSSHASSPTPEPLAPAQAAPAPPVHSAVVSAQLTHHVTIPAQGRGKPKEKKELKTKELKYSFSPTSENYVEFLQAILAKHGEEKYNITAKKRFSFKAICPPSKAYVHCSLSSTAADTTP